MERQVPPEAPTETTASRILWGIGYHQPPVYYVPSWNASKATSPNPQMSARFREKKPDLHGLDAKTTWSDYQNPFVGTPQMNGLLVLQAMLGNSDLKDAQNALYKLKEPFEGAKHWYVAGISARRSAVPASSMRHVATSASSSRRRSSPVSPTAKSSSITADGTASSSRTSRRRTSAGSARSSHLTDAQWHDAFRAGGFAMPIADRFIVRMKQKIADGLALKD